MKHEDIIQFWFEETPPKLRWVKDPEFDARIRERFAEVHAAAQRGELQGWRESAEGRLAEIIVLDQFSRNMYRDDPRAFAFDPLALVLAQEAVRAGADQAVDPVKRPFFYLPYMHSESPKIHQHAVALYTAFGNERNLDYELRHQAIIDRFGRYPHRNAVLGRESTEEELAFLETKGSSF